MRLAIETGFVNRRSWWMRLTIPSMIPSLRQAFNRNLHAEKYPELLSLLAERCGMPIGFRVSETPCFFPEELLDHGWRGRKGVDPATGGQSGVSGAVGRVDSGGVSGFRNEAPHPMFVQVDFGLVRDAAGELQPKLVELQAFPSLYAYQPVLARDLTWMYIGLDRGSALPAGAGWILRYLSGSCCGGRLWAIADPENVILMEIDPLHQKTLPDFLLTEKMLGIRTVDITGNQERRNRLYYERRDGGCRSAGFTTGQSWMNWNERT